METRFYSLILSTLGDTASFPLALPLAGAPPAFLAAGPLLGTAVVLLVGAFFVVDAVVFVVAGFAEPFGAGFTGGAFFGGILLHPICIIKTYILLSSTTSCKLKMEDLSTSNWPRNFYFTAAPFTLGPVPAKSRAKSRQRTDPMTELIDNYSWGYLNKTNRLKIRMKAKDGISLLSFQN
jgi:hypothetical protein